MLLKLTELSSCRRCFTISITSEHSELVCFNTTSAICKRWITSRWRRWNSKHRAHQHSILWLCFVNWKRGKYSTSSTCIVTWRSERDCTHETISFPLFKLSRRLQVYQSVRKFCEELDHDIFQRNSVYNHDTKLLRNESEKRQMHRSKSEIDLHFQI